MAQLASKADQGSTGVISSSTSCLRKRIPNEWCAPAK
jgi:hypothetical protein